jgi:F-type H+-transporting ATPase subunit b
MTCLLRPQGGRELFSEASGMIEEIVKHWVHIPILMGMVVLYALLLNAVFFKPVQRILDRRKERASEASNLSAASREALDRKFSEYEQAVLEARRKGTKIKEAARSEVAAKREKMLAEMRGQVQAEVSRGEAALKDSVSRARVEIESSAPGLARLAADRILGRRAS